MKVLELVNMTREKNALIQHINRTLETLTREDLSELSNLIYKELEKRDMIAKNLTLQRKTKMKNEEKFCSNCKKVTSHFHSPEVLVCENCSHFESKDGVFLFCGFCRGKCKGNHYISPSTEGY